jgi:hypothetical protein
LVDSTEMEIGDMNDCLHLYESVNG